MDEVRIKCRDLMVGDWVSIPHGFAMQIVDVGEDYAYATWEDNEGDPWEYDDKIEPPYPILLTREILEKNGFEVDDKAIWRIEVDVRCSYSKKFGEDFMCYSVDIEEMEEGGWFDFGIDCCLWQGVAINYVHELQHALRLAGLTEMANNFKI